MTLKDGINKCTNQEYHADNEYLSSSSYKLLLTDLPKFYKEKILKQAEPQEEKPYFIEGSYVHTLILEPEMAEVEYAFFPGNRKHGPEWEEFKAQNGSKQILSAPQKIRCDKFYKAYEDFRCKMNPIKGGEAEYTICGTYNGIKTKVRCDYINIDKGYIIDVKTSSLPVDQESFAQTVEKYRYDLSAALYTGMVEQYYKKRFEFYFLCIGKNDLDCQLFRLSESSREAGNNAILKASLIYKNCLLNDCWNDKLISDYEILDV